MTALPASRIERALALLWLRGCDAVGDAPSLAGRPWIENSGRLVVGARLRLSSRPVQSHLVVARGGLLELGEDVHVGHGAAIAAHEAIRIGDGARIGPFAVLSDTDFHVAGDRDARPETQAIVIGRSVRLGSRVTVLRGSTIGDGARVRAGSVVSGEIAPGAVVGGVPARPLRSGPSVSEDDPGTRVPEIVAATLGLATAPAPGSGPHELVAWDSLGALSILLALEEAFGVTLDESAGMRARGVSDLTALVEAALARKEP